MHTDTERKKYVEKVRALLAKATDPGATEAEAEAFTKKAQDLMEKWVIQDAELAAAGKGDRRIVTEVAGFVPNGVYGGSLSTMAVYLDEVYDTFTVMTRDRIDPDTGKRAKGLLVTGFSDDVENYRLMWASLRVQVDQRMASPEVVAQMKAETGGGVESGGYRIRWKNVYIGGFSLGAWKTLLERKHVAREYVPTSTALVLVGKKDQVDAAVKEQFPNLRTSRTQNGGGFHGAKAQGYSDGKKVGQAGVGSGTKGALR